MKQRRFALPALAAVVSLAAVSLTGCSAGGSTVSADCKPKHDLTTLEKGNLKVSLYDLPPFSKFENGQAAGVDGAIINEFAKEECLNVQAASADTAAVIPAVQNKQADAALAAWYRTKARDAIVGLSDPIYTDQMGIISKDGIKTVSALEGKNVGTVSGYLWEEDMKRVLGDKLKLYKSTLDMNQDLKAGRIDVGIDSYGSGIFNNKDGAFKVEVVEPDSRVASSKEAAQIAIPVTKDNDKLLKALNEFIKTIKADGRLKKMLTDNGLKETAADTGAPRLI